MMTKFSLNRVIAVAVKEFIQVKRDKITLGMMIGIPLLQLILFGFAINSEPKHLSTVVYCGDSYNAFTMRYVSALKNSRYFELKKDVFSADEAKHELLSGDADFVLTIPPGFYRKMLSGKKPEILLEANSVDPQTTSAAVAVAQTAFDNVLKEFAKGPLTYLYKNNKGAGFIVHRNFNPDNIMQYSTVPSLLGVILTLTLVMITSLSMTKEAERGTMENLLCMPVSPVEVLLGKIGPYIVMGLIQMVLILIAGHFIFHVPVVGNVLQLFFFGLIFIIATLSVGIVFSTIAKNQLQAVMMSMFFFLPSIMLSGFMFPFKAMPEWAQWIGICLPLTHFNIIVRGIMIKGAEFSDLISHMYSIIAFFVIVMLIGIARYRRTLD